MFVALNDGDSSQSFYMTHISTDSSIFFIVSETVLTESQRGAQFYSDPRSLCNFRLCVVCIFVDNFCSVSDLPMYDDDYNDDAACYLDKLYARTSFIHASRDANTEQIWSHSRSAARKTAISKSFSFILNISDDLSCMLRMP